MRKVEMKEQPEIDPRLIYYRSRLRMLKAIKANRYVNPSTYEKLDYKKVNNSIDVIEEKLFKLMGEL